MMDKTLEQNTPVKNAAKCNTENGFQLKEDDDVEALCEKLESTALKTKKVATILDDVSLDGVVKYIKSRNCKNIVTMVGAGISTSAGVPDFRSPGFGLYHNHPKSTFEIDYFIKDPKPFYLLSKQLFNSVKPTKCHYFVKLLEDKGCLLKHYTQNIDTLEKLAGLGDDKLVEAHGTFQTGHCLTCDREYKLEWMKEIIFRDEIPTCVECKGLIKPDIILFGEDLPTEFHKQLDEIFAQCDLLLVMGTSLTVQPFASFVDRVPLTTPRLVINGEKVGVKTEDMPEGSGMHYDSEDNSRDVFWLGKIDDGCQLLADKLGWGEELREMMKTGHQMLDAKPHV